MIDLSALADTLRQQLGNRIGVGVTDPRAPAPPLWPEEMPATARMVDKRHREFAAGRAAVRAAMADLALPSAAIPMGADRAPCWPTGCIGSISHCDAVAIALITRTGHMPGLGLDIEEETPLDTALWSDVLTAKEQDWIMQQPEPDRGRQAKRIFSVKEAVYKAQYPLTGRVLGFEAVSVTLDAHSFLAHLPQTTHPFPTKTTGQISHVQGHIVSVCAGLPFSPTQPENRLYI